MSSLLLPIALVATFSAVVVIALAVEAALSDRRRVVKLLETQVGSVSTDMREDELSKPFAQRALIPMSRGLGSVVKRVTPADLRDRIARKLLLAGSPEGWDADKVAAFKVVGLVAGGALGVGLSVMLGRGGITGMGIPVIVALLGWTTPSTMISAKANARQETIRRALPDTMDLLTISVEAGLGFDAALAQVIRNVPGPLSDEIGRMLQEIQLGVSRVDGFRHLAERTDVDELNAFVLAMIQADVFGVSVAKVLRAQAKELRVKRRQRAEHKAMQTPVKLLFPLIFCILPALFVVVIGPGAIRLTQNFFGLGS